LGLRNPVLLRVGLHNTLRRPTQTLNMTIGLVLSTALITTFFGLPDSFRSSITTDRMAKVGAVNETVTGPLTQGQITRTQAQLRQMPPVQATAPAFDNEEI
jgi:putative ABC transport system permease protein